MKKLLALALTAGTLGLAQAQPVARSTPPTTVATTHEPYQSFYLANSCTETNASASRCCRWPTG